MPLPDTFTGSDGTLLDSYDATWVKNSAYTGSAKILGNKAVKNSGESSYYWNASPSSANYDVFCNAVLAATDYHANAGVVGRSATTSKDFYIGKLNGVNAQIGKYVAGSFTNLGAAAHGMTIGVAAELRLVMSGTAISVKINGTAVVSNTDSSHSGAGYCGLWYDTNSTITIDDFNCTGIGGAAAVLAAAALAQASSSGALTTQIPLAAVAQAQAAGSATLTTRIPLAGSALAQAGATASLSATIRLDAAAIAQATASGSLGGAGAELVAAALVVADAGGTLTTRIDLAGTAIALSVVDGVLTALITLSGAAISEAAAGGTLSDAIIVTPLYLVASARRATVFAQRQRALASFSASARALASLTTEARRGS